MTNPQPPPKSKKRFAKRSVCIVAGLLMFLGVMAMGNWFAKKPAGLGLQDGKLARCPESPNCVCSEDDDEMHQISPFTFEGDSAAALSRLAKLMEKWPRARIVSQTDNYLHVEFTTPVLRFVDDVEFLLVPDERVIHVRSASRVGYSDMGANRTRMEKIREAFPSAGK